MTFTETAVPGLIIIEPRIWRDDRGHFFESYNQKVFAEAGIHAEFVQDNQSLSQRGTVRGLHAQAEPFTQGKLVRVINGRVIDVAVDIRVGSPTYGKHVSVELSGENKRMFWVPPGFLHGFITLEDDTVFTYKVSGLYNKESEIGVIWNDPDLNIDWQMPEQDLVLSEKDRCLQRFSELKSPFKAL